MRLLSSEQDGGGLSRAAAASAAKADELTLRGVDPCQIAAGIVTAAPLTAREPKAAAGVRVAGAGSAQVDDGREVLPLLQRGSGDAVAPKEVGDAAVQQRGGRIVARDAVG